MTGTAREVRSELWSDYGLRVRRIPLHRPSRQRELPALIYPRAAEKWAAVVESVKAIHDRRRPVLIGTASVEDSELLSRKLTAAGIAHRVLNARQDQAEAEIVAVAGTPGSVTVATNMAGRGTDIPLAPGVAELGGLHVIAACRNNAGRIDRQLSGRCARQGDPGSHQRMVSLEDDLLRQNGSAALNQILSSRWKPDRVLQRKLALYLVRRAQRKLERRHREARRALRQFDRLSGRMLAFSGQLE
jgi:preprotein translocase subunit SecA